MALCILCAHGRLGSHVLFLLIGSLIHRVGCVLQLIVGLMDAFSICIFIVAWRLGGVGFIFAYLSMVSFYITFLLCFSDGFIVF
jgi:hypothetical protein